MIGLYSYDSCLKAAVDDIMIIMHTSLSFPVFADTSTNRYIILITVFVSTYRLLSYRSEVLMDKY